MSEPDPVGDEYFDLYWEATSLASSALTDVRDGNDLHSEERYDESISKYEDAEEKYLKSIANLKRMCELAEGRDDLDCETGLIDEEEKCVVPKLRFAQKLLGFERDGVFDERCLELAEDARIIDQDCAAVVPHYDDYLYPVVLERCQGQD